MLCNKKFNIIIYLYLIKEYNTMSCPEISNMILYRGHNSYT
jgi:hypothetical protein